MYDGLLRKGSTLDFLAIKNVRGHSRRRSNVLGIQDFDFCPILIKFAKILITFAHKFLLVDAAASPAPTRC